LVFPGGGGNLYCVPGTAERWGVGRVEVDNVGDAGAVADGGGARVDAFGDFGGMVAEELRAEEPASEGL
jgi:hypothetical protein